MKIIFKKILQYYLKYITKLVLVIHHPVIIAIAGSTNKTFAKEEINKILRQQGVKVRSNPKSFNTEIGLPLAILYLPSGYNSYKNWLPIISKAFFAIFQRNFPQYLVLELGVSNPGDMKYLLSIIKPQVAVITDITQRYMESFGDMDKISKEYEYLVKNIKKIGLVMLNYDNIKIRSMKRFAKARVEFFSIKSRDEAPCEISNLWQSVEVNKTRNGQIIKASHDNIIKQYEINRFGSHHVYNLLIGLIIKDYVKREEKSN